MCRIGFADLVSSIYVQVSDGALSDLEKSAPDPATDLTRYSQENAQSPATDLVTPIRARVEMGAQEYPTELIKKAEVIAHQVRVRRGGLEGDRNPEQPFIGHDGEVSCYSAQQ
jgi:hypothetical protein